MELTQIQLPSKLLQRLRQETASDQPLSQVVAEAVQIWLERRREQKGKQDRSLQTLREAGMVMGSKRQHELAKAIMISLHVEEIPTRAHVEASLSKLQVPLSEEILDMRGKR